MRRAVTAFAVVPVPQAQVRGIRNLHRTKHARYKSMSKGASRARFSRQWYLFAGNNYEQHLRKGHELEATENFATYAFDSREDGIALSTPRLSDLPPIERYNALLFEMKERWRVLDGGRSVDKLKMALQAAECFEELAQSTGTTIADWPEDHATSCRGALEAVAVFAAKAHDSSDTVVPCLVRLAQVADSIGERDTRDATLRTARRYASTVDHKYAFAQPADATRTLKEPAKYARAPYLLPQYALPQKELPAHDFRMQHKQSLWRTPPHKPDA